MPRKPKPPLGVMPFAVWIEREEFPDLIEWVRRYAEVDAAVVRFRKAKLEPRPEWLAELGVR